MLESFKFKKFSIRQDRCAAKIGTDGVLLGAWVSLRENPQNILDIGAGTGVISLMMAQRSNAELIDALEIDEAAYEQAVDNFENSDWGDRLFCYHAAFDEFVEEMKDEQIYDLIISNPPFYTSDFSSGDSRRDQARFAKALPFEDLISGAGSLLSEEGIFCVIIPIQEEVQFLQLAETAGLFPRRITRVKGAPQAAVKRLLIELGFRTSELIQDELVLEESRHHYTEEYRNLVSPFYLKL